MAERMSEERLKNLKREAREAPSWIQEGGGLVDCDALAEALVEIDALKAEVARLREQLDWAMAKVQAYTAERQKWRSMLGLSSTDDVVRENERLEAEVARLRGALNSLANEASASLSEFESYKDWCNTNRACLRVHLNEALDALRAGKDGE